MLDLREYRRRPARLADDHATMKDVVRDFFKARSDCHEVVLLFPWWLTVVAMLEVVVGAVVLAHDGSGLEGHRRQRQPLRMGRVDGQDGTMVGAHNRLQQLRLERRGDADRHLSPCGGSGRQRGAEPARWLLPELAGGSGAFRRSAPRRDPWRLFAGLPGRLLALVVRSVGLGLLTLRRIIPPPVGA